jgi:hypothetical protein
VEKSELESELKEKAAELEAQINALNDELSEAKRKVVELVKSKPWLVLGGTLVAGLFVGLLFGGRRRVIPRMEDGHRAFIDAYIDAVVSDARHAIVSGEETGEAIRMALQDRVPVIVYSQESKAKAPGLFRQLLELSITTGVGFGVRSALERLTSTLNSVQADLAADGTIGQDVSPDVAGS